jgi:hypothetical protein
VKWYDYAKWLLERVENFPKSQRFVRGQRLTGQALDVMDLLVEASYAREDKSALLAQANKGRLRCYSEKIHSQCDFSISGLPECGLLVNHPPRGASGMDRRPVFFHENFRTPWHVS